MTRPFCFGVAPQVHVSGFVVLLTVLLLSASFAPRGQTPAREGRAQADQQIPPVTFKVEINYVEVDAVVVDRDGSFVRDLTRDDFEVFEDGRRQNLSAFSLVDIPVERPERLLFRGQPIESDVKTNAAGLDGRIYVLVLDDLHTAALRSSRVRAAARQFIEQQLGANDLAAVVVTSGRADASQEFTTNRTLLLDAVGRFAGRKLRSPTLEMLDQYQLQRNAPGGELNLTDPVEAQRAHYARSVFNDLQRISDLLAGVRGRRKAVVFISEGIDYNVNDPFTNPNAGSLREAARDAIAAATRANVNIYAVDPRGLTALGDEGMQMSAPPDDPSLGLGTQSLMAELRLSQDSLRVVANETGGFAAVDTNDFKNAFARIVRENSSYYLLGYYADSERRDGRFRRIEVRVKRPGIQVRARSGYAAPPRRSQARSSIDSDAVKSEEMREALESPVPMSGLTISASAAPFRGTGSNASVLAVVQVSGRELKFAEKSGRFDENIEVSLIALDKDGKVRDGDRQTLSMALKPETRAVVEQVGFRMVSRLDLPPGRYQLRVAGRAVQGQRIGSVYSDVVVPDFSRSPLTMSGLVLTSRRAGLVPTPRPDEQLGKLLPGPPTTARMFLSDDELAMLVEVYDNQRAKAHRVRIATTVRAEDGRTVFQHADERTSSELAGKRGGYGYTVRIPLNDLGAGLFELRVEARSTLGNEVAVRELQFGVRGR